LTGAGPSRPIRDQETGYSNHASATAIDLNATQHPRGVKRTWTTAERAAIDRHLAEYEGVVRWVSTTPARSTECTSRSTRRRLRSGASGPKLQALDAERAHQEEDDMPTAQEIAKAVVEAPSS
jgi:hypothetical protein